MQDGLTILDVNQKHIFENEAMRRMCGFSTEELAQTTIPFPYWPPEELEKILSAFGRTVAGIFETFELIFMHKNGTRFWVLVSPSELRDENGLLVGHFATIKDISERKRLERALLDSEQRWRSIAENPFDFVVVIDTDYRYIYVNHSAPGINAESLIGKATPFDFTDPVYHPIMREAFQTTFETGKATSYDVYISQLDSWYSSIVGAIKEDGPVTSISILTRDITQQKRAEEALRKSEHQLRESHRLQSIGTLAGGIAHDLNNLLTPMLIYTELAQLALESDHPVREYVDGIQTAGIRARDLVKRILLFGRRHEAKKELVELSKQVREGIKLVQATTPANISFELTLLDAPAFVLADPTQLHQVLTNLAQNGIQAMHNTNGCLRVSLQTGTLNSMQITAPPDREDFEYVHLTVSDTGSGMDDETQRRIFEPFFTTKEVGSGTGLGLSIVHGIIQEHGGIITLKTKLGEGTSFIISLPRSKAMAEAQKIPIPSKPDSQIGSKRILCVDDEISVLTILKKTLELAGHSVTIISYPLVALDLFQKDPSAFDLLLSDQTMPHLLGHSLVRSIRVHRQNMPSILMTGLGDHELEQNALESGVSEILSKPFLPSELRNCVESVFR